MFYMICLFILSGIVGTLISLRLQALEIQDGHKTNLTRRGRIVVSVFIGLAIGLFVFFVSGLWWECDINGQNCGYDWRY